MEFSLKIYVTPYQKKLLEFSLGKSPFRVNLKHKIGKLIFYSFVEQDIKPKPVMDRKKTSEFELIIPLRWIKRYNFTFVNEKQIEDYIELQEHQFRLQLYQYLNGVLDYKEHMKKNNVHLVAQMKSSALMFLQKNGFNEDDVKFETIKKGYQRYLSANRSSVKQGDKHHF